MNNELLFGILTLLSLGAALGASRFGRAGLQAYIIVCLITLYCITGKLTNAFGLALPIGVPLYAGIFLATDMLTEFYGKKAGYHMVRLSLLSGITFMAFTQIALLFEPLTGIELLSESMNIVFSTSIRIFIASVIAYAISQHFDVWFYHFIHNQTADKMLWLRNNGSTITSQFIDSVIFFTIAFYGTMPAEQFFQLLVVGYLGKVIVALLDTPFMYLSRFVHRPSSDKK